MSYRVMQQSDWSFDTPRTEGIVPLLPSDGDVHVIGEGVIVPKQYRVFQTTVQLIWHDTAQNK
jgi:hypothetical protein